MNLFRTITLKILECVKSVVRVGTYCLKWPDNQMPKWITFWITVLHPSMSLYWGSITTITEYKLYNTSLFWKFKKFMKHYSIKLDRIDRIIFNEIQIRFLAVIIHFIMFGLIYLWYSPHIQFKQIYDQQKYTKNKKYCILSFFILIPVNTFLDLKYDLFGDYGATIHILSIICCSYFSSYILETWLNSQRNINGLIPKILNTIVYIIEKYFISFIDKLHSKIKNDRSKLFIAIPFQGGIMTNFSWILFKFNKFIYDYFKWHIELFQNQFNTKIFWLIYHTFAFIIGFSLISIGLWLAHIVEKYMIGFGIYLASLLLAVSNINNILLYADTYDDGISFGELTITQTVWIIMTKPIVFTLIGHIILHRFFTSHLIILSKQYSDKMNENIDISKGIWVLFYIINCVRYGFFQIINLLHRYILFCIMCLYFALLGFYLFWITFKHVLLIKNIINERFIEKTEINDTYKMIKYLHCTMTLQEKEVIQMLLYVYLDCPLQVAQLIASFVSDIE